MIVFNLESSWVFFGVLRCSPLSESLVSIVEFRSPQDFWNYRTPHNREGGDSGGHTCVRMRAGLEVATGRVSWSFLF